MGVSFLLCHFCCNRAPHEAVIRNATFHQFIGSLKSCSSQQFAVCVGCVTSVATLRLRLGMAWYVVAQCMGTYHSATGHRGHVKQTGYNMICLSFVIFDHAIYIDIYIYIYICFCWSGNAGAVGSGNGHGNGDWEQVECPATGGDAMHIWNRKHSACYRQTPL